jgi:hypothetical protein
VVVDDLDGLRNKLEGRRVEMLLLKTLDKDPVPLEEEGVLFALGLVGIDLLDEFS